MKAPTAEQIAKLPTWARYHIANCQREKDRAISDLHAYLDKQKPSMVWLEGILKPRAYIQGDRIHFGNPNDRDYSIEVVAFGERIVVRGYGAILVEPMASNTVEIKLRP